VENSTTPQSGAGTASREEKAPERTVKGNPGTTKTASKAEDSHTSPNDVKPDATSTSNLPTTSTDTQPKEKPTYLPNIYEPPTPAPIARQKWTRNSIEVYGVPSYTTPYKMALTLTGLRANYMDVHDLFSETYDPYSDVFFFFSPGFGFPSPTSVLEETGEPLPQVASPTEWGPVLPALLATKCAIFVTGFSPTDVERDVRSLSKAPGVAGQFDWLITPGPNPFGSEKWEVADFDPRVMVKVNWGIWGIRGKSRDIKERTGFDWLRLKG
jgi:splicing suppressor protein 51